MPIYCHRCYDEIKSQYDLVVIPGFIKLYPYHAECYGLETKGRNSFSLSKPINSTRGTITPFFMIFLYLFYLLNDSFRVEPFFHIFWIIIILIPTYQRLYSYYQYEKKL